MRGRFWKPKYIYRKNPRKKTEKGQIKEPKELTEEYFPKL